MNVFVSLAIVESEGVTCVQAIPEKKSMKNEISEKVEFISSNLNSKLMSLQVRKGLFLNLLKVKCKKLLFNISSVDALRNRS